MDSVEALYYDGYQGLYALKDFHQGEVILAQEPVNSAIRHSCEPNAAVRNGRIVAWACIKKEAEITLDYKKTLSDCNCGAKHCKGRLE